MVRFLLSSTLPASDMWRPFFYICLLLLGLAQVAYGSRHISRPAIHYEKHGSNFSHAAEQSLWKHHSGLVDNIKAAMLASIRTRYPYFMVILSEPISLMLLPVGSKEQQHRQSSKLTIPNTLYLARRLLSFTETLPLLLFGLP